MRRKLMLMLMRDKWWMGEATNELNALESQTFFCNLHTHILNPPTRRWLRNLDFCEIFPFCLLNFFFNFSSRKKIEGFSFDFCEIFQYFACEDFLLMLKSHFFHSRRFFFFYFYFSKHCTKINHFIEWE